MVCMWQNGEKYGYEVDMVWCVCGRDEECVQSFD
jgi:hypothetical protein